MISDYKLTDNSVVEEALNGYPASEWLANSSNFAQYRDEYISYCHYEDLRETEGQYRTPEEANIRVGNISPQSWSVRIPCWAAENGSKLVRIPRGQDVPDLPLPDGVTHVTLVKILKNITGTTIASSGIGQDVLADDAEHEFRTKFKHDIV
ncbi:unnamed protein product [Prunus armeniaca]